MTSVALPRSVAARITVHSVATTQRLLAAVGSGIAALIVIDVLVSRGVGDYILLIVAPFLGVGVLALVLLWRPSVLTAVLFVAGGAVFSLAVPVLGLAVDPQFDDQGPFLLNRLAMAVCLVGAVNGRALNGLIWTLVAFAVAQSSVLLGLTLSGSTVDAGIGPLIVFTISFVAYLTLAIAQGQSARRLAPLTSASDEVLEADRQRLLEQRAASIVHDTLLADLAAISRSPGELTRRTRTVLTEHLAVVAAASVADPVTVPSTGSALGDSLRELAHEYQWSGVRVDVSGSELLTDTVSSVTRHALVGATRAALDNVVKHAGTDRAELVAGMRDSQLTVLVVDDGNGFKSTEVSGDRLGLRVSIEQRITQVGGTVRIWSGPDGTTVMMTVPVAGDDER